MDGTTYLTVRDHIIEAALDAPPAVIVDVTALDVPAPSAWSVFTSARWHVSIWPDVPILLICAHRAWPRVDCPQRCHPLRAGLSNRGRGDQGCSSRRPPSSSPCPRAAARDSREPSRVAAAGQRVARRLVAARAHSGRHVDRQCVHGERARPYSGPTGTQARNRRRDGDRRGIRLQLSTRRSARAPGRGSDHVSGLATVAAMSRAWGSAPTSSGKTVWALVGPENRL